MNTEQNNYYNLITFFCTNLKWYQKLYIKLMLILPKGRNESKRFNKIARGYRAKTNPIDDAMNKF